MLIYVYVCNFDSFFHCQMKVSNLDFYHRFSDIESLRAEEHYFTYPPRFKLSVQCNSHGTNLEAKFKITLQNDGVLSNDVKEFPLPIIRLRLPGKIRCIYNIAMFWGFSAAFYVAAS